MSRGADRISDLPEGVLHHVLSFLPAQDAVRTCVLAQRWRHLWRSAPAVSIVGSDGWAGGFDALDRFVDGLLRHRLVDSPLDSCEFDLDLNLDPSWAPAVERHGKSWIGRALGRGALELRFRVFTSPRLPFTLPDLALDSQHLTRLELVGVQGNASVLDFSYCPALEDFAMEDSSVGSTDIHSSSLKRLSIKYCVFYPNHRTVMDFPSLVSFEFITNGGRVPLLESMPYLETATVRYDNFYDDRCRNNGCLEDCGDDACHGCYYYYGPDDYECVFLEGLTEATDLSLTAYPDLSVFIRDLKWCPIFSNLKTLALSKWFVSAKFSALIWFLHHAPLLEKLTLKVSKEHNNLMKTVGSYEPPEQSIAASHLQIVEIICINVDGMVLKILKVLNANGVQLEKIRIQCSGRFNFVCTDVNSKQRLEVRGW